MPGATIDRNSVLPEKIPPGELIILRDDGDPGEPEQALGGFGTAYYQQAVEIEVYVRRAMRRRVTLPSTTSCSRSVLRSTLTQRSEASPSA